MLGRSRFDMRDDKTPEPGDLPGVEAECAIATAVIVDALTREPEQVCEVISRPLGCGERPLLTRAPVDK
jgi:hypothetical protein